MKKSRVPRPPAGLTPEARRWWARLASEYEFNTSDLLLLEEAMRSLDRLREAQAHIAEHGSVFKDRWGQLRPNPAVLLERDCRTSLVRLFKALRLDMEVIPPAGKR